MKRNVISTVILAVLALLAVDCTPENVAPEPQPNETTRNVSYVKCGESGHATVTGDEAWHALLGTLFDAVDEGCEVSFWEAAGGSDKPTKESVTYRTASRDSAYAWGERMYDQGYTVSVIFDADSGQYVCSAVKTTSDPERVFRNVGIASCGGVYSNGRRIGSETEWVALLDSLFDVADSGCLIAVWNFDYIPDTNQTKSAITYSTPLRDSAFVWIDTMFNRNYCTTVVFNPVDRVYILTAKPLTTGPQWSNPDNHSLYYSFFMGLALAVEMEEPLVINSQEQFDSLMPYTFLPYYIDFNTQSLICAWGSSPSNIVSMESNIEYNESDVTVSVDINLGGHPYSPCWYIALPCDKITDGCSVALYVNYIHLWK